MDSLAWLKNNYIIVDLWEIRKLVSPCVGRLKALSGLYIV